MKLNKKKVAVLGLAGLLALGGAGGALAYIINGATQSGSYTADDVLYVNFSGSDTVASITGLTPSTPQYYTLKVNWNGSSLVTGDVKVSFTLTDVTTAGLLSVAIAESDWKVSASVTALATLTKTSASTELTCGSYSGATKTKSYYLKFMMGESLEDVSTENCKLTISLKDGQSV